ncbi:hypothetical protein PENTCL1PPCAC_17179, partial [Pristionchus entomophagus]
LRHPEVSVLLSVNDCSRCHDHRLGLNQVSQHQSTDVHSLDDIDVKFLCSKFLDNARIENGFASEKKGSREPTTHNDSADGIDCTRTEEIHLAFSDREKLLSRFFQWRNSHDLQFLRPIAVLCYDFGNERYHIMSRLRQNITFPR